MSGNALLLSLFPSTGSTSSILSAVYGTGTGGGMALSSNPVVALTLAENTQTQGIANEAKQPQTSRDIAAFTAAVKAAKTPAQLLQNPTVLKVLLTANGLGDQASYPALAQKALLSNPSSSNALCNQLSDSNWKSAAQTYQFSTKGLSVLQNPTTLATIANGYAEVLWRQSLDAQTPGLSNALTFRGEASTITSVDQILGDPIMRAVVTTALGLPEQIAYQDLGAQGNSITSRLNIKDFQNPNFVNSFTQRYLVAAAEASSSASGAQQANSLIV